MTLFSLLAENAALFIAICTVLGLIVGSFLNVVIHRLPLMLEREWKQQCREILEQPPQESGRLDLLLPRSHCPHCKHTLSSWENIPLLSYLLQRGRCRHCGHTIAMRYPLVEGLTGLLSAVVAWHFGYGVECAAALLLTWALVPLVFIDLDHQILPDNITLPMLWLGLALNLGNIFTSSHGSIIGAMAGYLSLWSVYQLFKLLTGREGMGYGDFKLLAMFGAWLGWGAIPLILIFSSLVGSVVGITLILLRRHQRQIPIPFGPYLAAAGWIALLWGEPISNAYLRWAGL